MGKKEVLATALAVVATFEKSFKEPKAYNSMVAMLTEELGPKSGGFSKLNIDEIIKVKDGKTVEIFDTVAKVWLPATSEFFYVEKDEAKQNPKLNGLKNHSKAREKVTKENVRLVKLSKDVIWNGVVKAEILSKEDKLQVVNSIPKIDFTRIQPTGENAGKVKASPEVIKYEELLARMNGKIAEYNKAATNA